MCRRVANKRSALTCDKVEEVSGEGRGMNDKMFGDCVRVFRNVSELGGPKLHAKKLSCECKRVVCARRVRELWVRELCVSGVHPSVCVNELFEAVVCLKKSLIV